MARNDESNDLLLWGLLKYATSWARREHDDSRLYPFFDRNRVFEAMVKMEKALGSGEAKPNLAELLDVPGRASIWIRDTLMRALVADCAGTTLWQQSGAAQKIVSNWSEAMLNRWLAKISGKRPDPLNRPQWFAGHVSKIRRAKGTEDDPCGQASRCFLAMAAQCQKIPLSQRGIYNIANKPTNAFVTLIEHHIKESYLGTTRP